MLMKEVYITTKSGTCYSGSRGATVSCDFTTTGLKNDTTRNMIEIVTWKLGGTSSTNNTAAFYTAERGTDVYDNSKPTECEGKIALMYPSDYGYATSGGSIGRERCLSTNLGYWEDYSNCYNNDWLYTGSYQWTLTSYSSNSRSVFDVRSDGFVDTENTYISWDIHPSVYLTSDVSITGGSGTESDPYTLAS